LVILGAGLDTRAYRLPGLSSVVVFEIDLPAIQRRTQRSLRGTPPVAREVRFVPVDLGVQPLAEVLRNAGLDAGRPVLFVWEGVTQCLSDAAVRSTLDVVAGSAPGSALVFTYVLGNTIGDAARRGRSTRVCQGSGVVEPWLFGLDQDEVPGFLEEFGLQLVADVGDIDYQQRYLQPVGRELLVGAGERVAWAVV
jgi:methyltransferase (TIGR00027 family)